MSQQHHNKFRSYGRQAANEEYEGESIEERYSENREGVRPEEEMISSED